MAKVKVDNLTRDAIEIKASFDLFRTRIKEIVVKDKKLVDAMHHTEQLFNFPRKIVSYPGDASPAMLVRAAKFIEEFYNKR